MNERTMMTLDLELGSRVLGDLRGENGVKVIREGVIRKRATLAGTPIMKSRRKAKVGETLYSKSHKAFFKFIRRSKRGNLVCRRSYGDTKGKVVVLKPEDIEWWKGGSMEVIL